MSIGGSVGSAATLAWSACDHCNFPPFHTLDNHGAQLRFCRHLMLDRHSFESENKKLIAEWSIKHETAFMQVWNPVEGVGCGERRL